METKISPVYNQILVLIQQLPENEILGLLDRIQAEILDKRKPGRLQELILHAPTWSDSDYLAYQEVRKSINTSRIS